MFLAGLEKDQKDAFLGLAHTLIVADGVLEARELSTMEQYRQEMNPSTDAGEKRYGVEQATAVFKTSSMAIKKQIMFELVALAYADKDFAEAENMLIEKFREELNLDKSFLEDCKKYVGELTDLYERIGRLVS